MSSPRERLQQAGEEVQSAAIDLATAIIPVHQSRENGDIVRKTIVSHVDRTQRALNKIKEIIR